MRKLISVILMIILVFLVAASAVAQSHVGHKSHNDRYVDPELDVEAMIDRFESEGREVFARREAIVRALDLQPGQVVADVGAGTGAFMAPILARIGATGHYYAVDIAPRFVAHLRDRAQAEGHANVTAVLGAFTSATLPRAAIDHVFICDTYHHFDEPAAMLASLHRALRPGGTLTVVEFDRVAGVSREWVLNHVRASKQEFRAEIEAAGFTFAEDVAVAGLKENFCLIFRRP